jgi:hypothetical protein
VRGYLFIFYVLLTTMVEIGCRAGRGQIEEDEEILFQERNVQELMIKDMQRQIIKLTHRLE